MASDDARLRRGRKRTRERAALSLGDRWGKTSLQFRAKRLLITPREISPSDARAWDFIAAFMRRVLLSIFTSDDLVNVFTFY